ncbi:four helix bundle protein [Candidatus Woesearchaeota archaeon]|nr:four helix bundle protein [Candidatus Woesearchaeota archaeon]
MQSDFKNLKVWTLSFLFAKNTYALTRQFPKEEQYALTSQLRRAAVSISNNIAEGCGRYTNKDFIKFLHIAAGSSKECENLLLLSQDLGYLTKDDFVQLQSILVEIESMLGGLIQHRRMKAED